MADAELSTANPAAQAKTNHYAAAVAEYWRRRPKDRRFRISKVGTPEVYREVRCIMDAMAGKPAAAPAEVAGAGIAGGAMDGEGDWKTPAARQPPSVARALQKALEPRPRTCNCPTEEPAEAPTESDEAFETAAHEDFETIVHQILSGLGFAKGGLAKARSIVHNPRARDGGLSSAQVLELRKLIGPPKARKSRAAGMAGGGRSGGALKKGSTARVRRLLGGDIYDGENLDVDADYEGGGLASRRKRQE